MNNKRFSFFAITLICLALFTACGGGSTSNKSIVIEGTLNQGATSSHKFFKHSEGDHIGEVEICALGECSTTNSEGEWGFATNDFNGGDVSFKITGHGIDTNTIVKIPMAEENILIKFVHSANVVTIDEMLVDGEEDHSNHDHTH